MDAISSSAPDKSLRQIPNSSYNRGVESHAQAPQRRLFHFSVAFLPFTRTAKPSIFNSLHTLKSPLSARYSFLNICALFEKHRGYTPKLPVLEPVPFTRIRFPERGPSRKLLAPSHPQAGEVRTRHAQTPISVRATTRHSVGASRFSLAIKKQSAPHSTETHPRRTTFSGYSRTRSAIFQETHR
jgi:hypothetical protein